MPRTITAAVLATPHYATADGPLSSVLRHLSSRATPYYLPRSYRLVGSCLVRLRHCGLPPADWSVAAVLKFCRRMDTCRTLDLSRFAGRPARFCD